MECVNLSPRQRKQSNMFCQIVWRSDKIVVLEMPEILSNYLSQTDLSMFIFYEICVPQKKPPLRAAFIVPIVSLFGSPQGNRTKSYTVP